METHVFQITVEKIPTWRYAFAQFYVWLKIMAQTKGEISFMPSIDFQSAHLAKWMVFFVGFFLFLFFLFLYNHCPSHCAHSSIQSISKCLLSFNSICDSMNEWTDVRGMG